MHTQTRVRLLSKVFPAVFALTFGCGVGVADPELPSLEDDSISSVESALVDIDSKCVGHLPSGKTTCVRLQKDSTSRVRAYAAVSASSGTMAVDSARLYWWANKQWLLVGTTPRVKGLGHVSAATGFFGPFPCGQDLAVCGTFEWSGQPGYNLCETYRACTGE